MSNKPILTHARLIVTIVLVRTLNHCATCSPYIHILPPTTFPILRSCPQPLQRLLLIAHCSSSVVVFRPMVGANHMVCTLYVYIRARLIWLLGKTPFLDNDFVAEASAHHRGPLPLCGTLYQESKRSIQCTHGARESTRTQHATQARLTKTRPCVRE